MAQQWKFSATMPTQTNSEMLFRQLQSLHSESEGKLLKHLETYIGGEIPTVELEWLDFKVGSGRQDDWFIEPWAKAVSGFANTAGGVVIWGINCREDKNSGIDAVWESSPAPDVFILEQTLKEYLARVSEPPVLGVEFLTVRTIGNAGYVVAYIPRSPQSPHRSLPKKQFPMRVGKQFDAIPLEMLRRMFFPESKARFTIFLQARIGRHSIHNYYSCTVSAQLHNSGTASADDLVMLFPTSMGPLAVLHPDPWTAVRDGRSGNAYEAMRTLHPGGMFALFDLTSGVLKMEGDKVVAGLNDLNWRIQLFCRNQPPMNATISMSTDQAKTGERLAFHFSDTER